MLASSAALACSRSSSGVVMTNALSLGLMRSMRSRYARVSAVDETSWRRTAAAWSRADEHGSMPVKGAGSPARAFGGPLGGDGEAEAAPGVRVAKHGLVDVRQLTPRGVA